MKNSNKDAVQQIIARWRNNSVIESLTKNCTSVVIGTMPAVISECKATERSAAAARLINPGLYDN